jgi:hypothetical protein
MLYHRNKEGVTMKNDTAVSPTHSIGGVYNFIWLLATVATMSIAYGLMITNQYSIAAFYGSLLCAVVFILVPRGL